MLAEPLDVVIGIATHTAAVTPASAVLEQLTVSTDHHGYRQLIEFGARHGARRLWAIEGTGTWVRADDAAA